MDETTIREIQEALRAISLLDPRLPLVVVDGIYSPQTQQAVMIFQSLYGIRPSGEVDRDTWEELRDLYREIKSKTPLEIIAFPHDQFALHSNDQHEVVRFIQLMLRSISSVFSNIQQVPITGIYDPVTETVIRQIQKSHRIEPTGVIDIKTWNTITQLYNTRLDSIKR